MALDLEMLMDTQAEEGFPAWRWVNMPFFLELFTSPQSLVLFSFFWNKRHADSGNTDRYKGFLHHIPASVLLQLGSLQISPKFSAPLW